MSETPRRPVSARDCARLLTDTMPKVMRSILYAARHRSPGTFEAVTMEQTQLLKMLEGGVHTLRLLAVDHGVTTSTMSRAIDVLVRNGWATREDDPEDRRQVIVRATPAGSAAVNAKIELLETELTRHLERLTPEQLAHVARGFRTLGTLLDLEPAGDLPVDAPCHGRLLPTEITDVGPDA